jgi:hypothetical protein
LIRQVFRSDLGGNIKFDFDTWLTQTYGLKAADLTKKELVIARKEYAEEYPALGEHPIAMKTYPFKRHLDSRKG